MKKTTIILLICCIIIGVSACGHNILYKTEYYDINYRNGNYTISFNNYILDNNQMSSHISDNIEITYPKFSSVKQMVETIKEGNFQKYDLTGLCTIAGPTKTLEMFDIENPLDATFPSDIRISSVNWIGSFYKFSLKSDAFETGRLECYNRNKYEEVFRDRYDNYLNEKQTIVSEIKTVDRNETEIVFFNQTGNYKLIRYQVSDGTRTLYIQEHYTLSHENPNLLLYPASEAVPGNIEIFGIDENKYFYVSLLGLYERPSVEWLSEFGLTPLKD